MRTRLDETLFVEAGAGTGKTTVLVDRIVELVTADGPDLPVPMRSVAAITFTEKAAAELRDRVRGELEERVARRQSRRRGPRRAAATRSTQLDDAAICTLHSFAQRILTAFPVEAGLPPRIEVHDEVSSLLSFDERWRRTRDDLLDDPELEPALLVLLGRAGAPRPPAPGRRSSSTTTGICSTGSTIRRRCPRSTSTAWLAELGRGVRDWADDCRDADDKLLARLGRARGVLRPPARGASTTPRAIELLLADEAVVQGRKTGSKTNWPDIDARARARIMRLGEQREATHHGGHRRRAAARSPRSSPARTAEHAADRPHARASSSSTTCSCCAALLLRDPSVGPGVRARLRERYQRLLIDEFQDTDPIQVEIAALLAAPDDDTDGRDWREHAGHAGPAVLRRRSQAVDLPLPAGRHLHVPRSPRPLHRRAAAAHLQLPLDRAGARRGSTTCSAA